MASTSGSVFSGTRWPTALGNNVRGWQGEKGLLSIPRANTSTAGDAVAAPLGGAAATAGSLRADASVVRAEASASLVPGGVLAKPVGVLQGVALMMPVEVLQCVEVTRPVGVLHGVALTTQVGVLHWVALTKPIETGMGLVRPLTGEPKEYSGKANDISGTAAHNLRSSVDGAT